MRIKNSNSLYAIRVLWNIKVYLVKGFYSFSLKFILNLYLYIRGVKDIGLTELILIEFYNSSIYLFTLL